MHKNARQRKFCLDVFGVSKEESRNGLAHFGWHAMRIVSLPAIRARSGTHVYYPTSDTRLHTNCRARNCAAATATFLTDRFPVESLASLSERLSSGAAAASARPGGSRSPRVLFSSSSARVATADAATAVSTFSQLEPSDTLSFLVDRECILYRDVCGDSGCNSGRSIRHPKRARRRERGRTRGLDPQ